MGTHYGVVTRLTNRGPHQKGAVVAFVDELRYSGTWTSPVEIPQNNRIFEALAAG